MRYIGAFLLGFIAAIGAAMLVDTAWPLAPKWAKIACMIAASAVVQTAVRLI